MLNLLLDRKARQSGDDVDDDVHTDVDPFLLDLHDVCI